jgi:hypothetical protein
MMSRSNPTLENPAKRFFTWKGGAGKLVWYDKEAKQEVEVKQPFSFMVLDQLATITGYDDKDESGYWSNEVRSVAKEPFTVKTAKGIKEVGLYKDLAVRKWGAKYAKSIYIAYKEGDVWVIGNLKASGAALTAWIEFGRKYNPNEGKVAIVASEEATKGATKYHIPVFEWSASDSNENDIAIGLDQTLQTYLNQYLTARRNVFGTDEETQDWAPSEDELNAALVEE